MIKFDKVNLESKSHFKLVSLLADRSEPTKNNKGYIEGVSTDMDSAAIAAILNTPVCELPTGTALISFNVYTFEGPAKVVSPLNYRRVYPTSDAHRHRLHMVKDCTPTLLGRCTYRVEINSSLRYRDPEILLISGDFK